MRRRILLSKLGLDGHDRALRLLARAARDAGHEVVLLGIGATPAEVARTAVAEDVDVVGISLLSGAQMVLLPALVQEMSAAGAADVPVVVGGTIPDSQRQSLLDVGIADVVPTGTPLLEGLERLERQAARA